MYLGTHFTKSIFLLSSKCHGARVMQLRQGNSSISEYIAKFEGGLRKDILATIGPMEIRDFSTLVNKCQLVDNCNRELTVARSTSSNIKRGLAPQGLTFLSSRKGFSQWVIRASNPRGLS